MNSLAHKIISFLHSLRVEFSLPEGIEVMNPYLSGDVKKVTSAFYRKFYNDNIPRTMILGINPGRFGAGVTGISFTDPIRLAEDCGIPNPFKKRQENSSVFIYDMIRAFGGCDIFYKKFYITAVCPLGFTFQGKNLNYYDRKDLESALGDFIIEKLKVQLDMGMYRETAFCIGGGKNFDFLKKLNKAGNYFDKIIPLPHPRFVMQYRYRQKEQFVQDYIQILSS